MRRPGPLLAFLATAGRCIASQWSDPTGDQLDIALPPELDLISISAGFEPGTFTLILSFDPATATPADLEGLSGWVDFDVDQDPNTGRYSHFDEWGIEPAPMLGVDYYVEFYPYMGFAYLVYVEEYVEYSVGLFPFVVDGWTVTVSLPRCQAAPDDGICIGANYDLIVLIGNASGPTDRAPNDASAFTATPEPGDLDEDGDVDQDDSDVFQGCMTGPNLGPPAGGCEDADFDGDEDVDQEDFGSLQRNLTGPM